MLTRLNLLNTLGQEYSPTLAICLWFYNESPLISVELFAQFAVLSRQQPGLGKKVVVLWCSFEHIHQAESQQILPGEYMYSREVANLLKELQSNELLGLNVMVSPQHVPSAVALH